MIGTGLFCMKLVVPGHNFQHDYVTYYLIITFASFIYPPTRFLSMFLDGNKI